MTAAPATENPKMSNDRWRQLADAAWQAREHARVHGKTMVGAAVLSEQGRIFLPAATWNIASARTMFTRK